MLEEQLAVLRGLWGEPDGWSYEGKHVRIRDAQFYPKPVAVPGRPDAAERRVAAADPRRWRGTPRSMRIAARYADEFNLSSSSPDVARTKFGAARRGVRGGRPRSRRRSPARRWSGVLIGRDRRRAASADSSRPRCCRRLRQRPSGGRRPGSTSARERAGSSGRRTRPGRGRALTPTAGAERIDAPGLPAARPRDGRPDGARTLVRPDVGQPGGPSVARVGLGRRTPRVERVVAADRVGVRAAGAGDPLGQELERRRRAEQRRDRRRQRRSPRRRSAGRPASARRGAAVLTSRATIAAVRTPTTAGRRERLAGPLEAILARRPGR